MGMRKQVAGRILVLSVALLVPCLAHSMSDKNKPITSDNPSVTQSEVRVGATGTVRTPSGAPVAGAVVFARSLDNPGKPIPEIAIVTSAEGTFHWPLKPGVYELVPMLGGRRGAPGTVTVPEGGLGTVDLTLPR